MNNCIELCFSRQAVQYDSQTEWRKDRKLLGMIRELVQEGSGRVIDVGTGTGIVGAEVAKLGWNVIGVDKVLAMLKQGQGRLPGRIVADVCCLPFYDGVFHGATMRQLLHYTDDVSVCCEARRVVRPGGWVVAADVVVFDERDIPWWVEMKSLVQPLRRRVYSADTHSALYTRAGWHVESIRHMTLRRTDQWNVFIRHIAHNHGKVARVRALLEYAASRKRGGRIGLKWNGEQVTYLQCWQLLRATR